MNKFTVVALMAGVVMVSGAFKAYAATSEPAQDVVVVDSAVADNAVVPAEVVQVKNKLCPVSHEEVGSEGMEPHQVMHNGKTYNLCCAMCEKDFNKDPDKYVKMMEDEVAGK